MTVREFMNTKTGELLGNYTGPEFVQYVKDMPDGTILTAVISEYSQGDLDYLNSAKDKRDQTSPGRPNALLQ